MVKLCFILILFICFTGLTHSGSLSDSRDMEGISDSDSSSDSHDMEGMGEDSDSSDDDDDDMEGMEGNHESDSSDDDILPNIVGGRGKKRGKSKHWKGAKPKKPKSNLEEKIQGFAGSKMVNKKNHHITIDLSHPLYYGALVIVVIFFGINVYCFIINKFYKRNVCPKNENRMI